MNRKTINDVLKQNENEFNKIKDDLMQLGYTEKHIIQIIESYIKYLKKYVVNRH